MLICYFLICYFPVIKFSLSKKGILLTRAILRSVINYSSKEAKIKGYLFKEYLCLGMFILD